MPARALSREQADDCIRRIEDCLKEGFHPPDSPARGRAAITEAGQRFAQETGRSPNTFLTRLRTARNAYGLEPDWSLWRAPQYQYAKGTARSPMAQVPHNPAVMEREGEPLTVLGIGDTHDDPRIHDQARFTWFGRMAAAHGVDAVVQIGDWGTWDSVSRHEDRATITGRALPSFEDDLGSFRMSLRRFQEGLDGHTPELYCTEGNHEKRIEIYENQNATLEGLMMNRVREAFMQYGWKTRPYGEFLFLEGVGFTHVPLNEMGKPYGGKTAEQRIANDATFSIVFGHSHKPRVIRSPKIGPLNCIKVINLGCALPYGHVESYARMSTTGWGFGAYLLRLQKGEIVSERWYDMEEIEREYALQEAA